MTGATGCRGRRGGRLATWYGVAPSALPKYGDSLGSDRRTHSNMQAPGPVALQGVNVWIAHSQLDCWGAVTPAIVGHCSQCYPRILLAAAGLSNANGTWMGQWRSCRLMSQQLSKWSPGTCCTSRCVHFFLSEEEAVYLRPCCSLFPPVPMAGTANCFDHSSIGVCWHFVSPPWQHTPVLCACSEGQCSPPMPSLF